jgi:hypothetical protein
MEKSMAAYAAQDESAMARDLNEHFRSKGIEFIATDTGGSGHNPDVTVKDILTEEPINKFESKRSGGSRTDFGQFRIYYEPESGWQFHETLKSVSIAKFVFSLIKPQLDTNVCGNFPHGPSLSEAAAHEFWDTHEPGRRLSICGDVLKVPIPSNIISDYYAEKENDYIKVGKDLYSLSNDEIIPTFESMVKESYALLRIKYHKKNRYSYTVAFRMKCDSSQDTEFFTALNKIY